MVVELQSHVSLVRKFGKTLILRSIWNFVGSRAPANGLLKARKHSARILLSWNLKTRTIINYVIANFNKENVLSKGTTNNKFLLELRIVHRIKEYVIIHEWTTCRKSFTTVDLALHMQIISFPFLGKYESDCIYSPIPAWCLLKIPWSLSSIRAPLFVTFFFFTISASRCHSGLR